jgi:hypothetical protein
MDNRKFSLEQIKAVVKLIAIGTTFDDYIYLYSVLKEDQYFNGDRGGTEDPWEGLPRDPDYVPSQSFVVEPDPEPNPESQSDLPTAPTSVQNPDPQPESVVEPELSVESESLVEVAPMLDIEILLKSLEETNMITL